MDRSDHLENLLSVLREQGTNPLSLTGEQTPDIARIYCRSGRLGNAYAHALLVENSVDNTHDPLRVLTLRMQTPAATRYSESHGLHRPPVRYTIRWNDLPREIPLSRATFGMFLFDMWRAIIHDRFVTDPQESYLHAPAIGPRQCVLPFTALPRT